MNYIQNYAKFMIYWYNYLNNWLSPYKAKDEKIKVLEAYKEYDFPEEGWILIAISFKESFESYVDKILTEDQKKKRRIYQLYQSL